MRHPGRCIARVLPIACIIVITAQVACQRTTAVQQGAAVGAEGGGIPSGPKAFTARDLDRVRIAWYDKVIGDAYEKVGLKGPAWDAAAREVIQHRDLFRQADDEASRKHLLELVQPAIKAHCQDPLVLYLIGIAYLVNDEAVKADPYLHQAVDGFGRVPYPRAIAALAPLALSRAWLLQHGDKAANRHQWVELGIKWIGEASGEQAFADKEQRVFWGQMLVGNTLDTHMKRVADAVQRQAKPDPWLREMTAGEAAIEEAWESRGGGWAYTVTDKGWKKFNDQLHQAHDHLVRAWTLHPDYPEAPTSLITVAMGGVAGPGESARVWFDRAVAGQFDYLPAYSRLLQTMMPRWGGSHEAMYQFGLDCLATKRFDTSVPEILFTAVSSIGDDGEPEIWTKPGVYQDLRAMFEGMLANPVTAATHGNTVRTSYAVVAWRCGAKQDAKKLLDALGDKADKGIAPTLFHVSLARIRWEVGAARPGKPAPAGDSASGKG